MRNAAAGERFATSQYNINSYKLAQRYRLKVKGPRLLDRTQKRCTNNINGEPKRRLARAPKRRLKNVWQKKRRSESKRKKNWLPRYV